MRQRFELCSGAEIAQEACDLVGGPEGADRGDELVEPLDAVAVSDRLQRRRSGFMSR